MGIEESNWLINKLNKGTAVNPYTPEEIAEINRKKELNKNKTNPVNDFILGRLNKVEQNFNRIRRYFGWVPPTHMEFSEKLDDIKRYLDVAHASKYFGLTSQGAADKIAEARETVGKLATGYRTLAKPVEKVDEFVKIFATCKALSAWANTSIKDPDYQKKSAEAAHHFDNLFGYLAGYVGALPPPLKAFSLIFSEISKNHFFSGMQKLLNAWYSGPGSLHDPDRYVDPE